MKVLLLNPPARNKKKFIREGRCTQEQGVWATLWPPVSLATIGAVLEQAKHEVRITDCAAEGIIWDDLKKLLTGFSPEFVIWSTGTPSISNDLGIASHIKEICPEINTAVFGTHVTALDRQCMLQFPHVDFIIRNEPEISALELTQTLQAGKSPEKVAGITFRGQNGQIISNRPRPFVKDLNTLPFPAWHLINIDSYTLPLKGRKFLIVAPQRGCPFNCSFCTCQTYYGKVLRKRSVEHVIAEIKHDIKQFNIYDFFFWSETFVIDKGYVAALCRSILESGLKISWTCNSRVDIVDEELLKLMSKAGCWMISFGIESGGQEVLDEAEKGIRVEQAYSAVRMARQAGISTAGHFIFGLPGETEGSMEKTLKMSGNLGLDIAQFYSAVPFPGSRLYEKAEKQGWIKNYDFSTLRQDHAVMEIPTVSSQTVNRYRTRAYKKFYFKPSAFFRILKLIEFKGLKQVWKTALDFLRWSE